MKDNDLIKAATLLFIRNLRKVLFNMIVNQNKSIPSLTYKGALTNFTIRRKNVFDKQNMVPNHGTVNGVSFPDGYRCMRFRQSGAKIALVDQVDPRAQPILSLYRPLPSASYETEHSTQSFIQMGVVVFIDKQQKCIRYRSDTLESEAENTLVYEQLVIVRGSEKQFGKPDQIDDLSHALKLLQFASKLQESISLPKGTERSGHGGFKAASLKTKAPFPTIPPPGRSQPWTPSPARIFEIQTHPTNR